MSRITIVHGSAADAAPHAAALRRGGHRVNVHALVGGLSLRELWERPPDAFVLSLDRRPSDVCAVAAILRQRKATRAVPLVFTGGEPDKVDRTRTLYPDAAFTGWGLLKSALRDALRGGAGAPPVVRGVMDAYSGTPLPKKLGIRDGTVVALLGAPGGFEETLGPLPSGVTLRRQARGKALLVLLFARSRADLAKRFATADRILKAGGSTWILWPKRASGVTTDLTQAHVRRYGLDHGYVDYKIAAIDATWSGLRFARRGARSKGSGRAPSGPGRA